MRFEDGKTEALNLRVSPSFKLALKALAESENRSMVNMLEVLVMERTSLAKSKLATANVSNKSARGLS